MRRIHVSALAVALVASWLVGSNVAGQAPAAPAAPAVFSPKPATMQTADIRVLTPGVVFASGLPDIAAAFTKGNRQEASASSPSGWAPSSRR